MSLLCHYLTPTGRPSGRDGSMRRSRPARPARAVVESLEPRCVLAAAHPTVLVDTILEWNAVMLEANASDHALTAPEQGGPILTARAFAIVSAAMYDVYNSIEHIGSAYLVSVPRAARANSDAAVAQAAHDTLVALFPSQQAHFDAALSQTLARIRDGRGENQGRAVGAYVASQILAARADDGAAQLGTPEYVATGLNGFHSADPLNPDQGYYAPGAENVTPFAAAGLDQFEARRLDDGSPEGRAAFLQSQEYADTYNEVLALGGDGITTPTDRTAEQTEIGIFWGYDGRPGLGTPPRLYNQIVRTIAVQQGNSEAENARLFALVNIAMADAGLTSWDDKYELALWRPILGIRSGDIDGNADTAGDAGWTPLGAPASNPQPGEIDFTPPFPAYTSGHSTLGAAAFQMLTRFYGTDAIRFSFTSDELNGVTVGSDGAVRPVVTRTFDSLTDAKIENAQSRIYLGIHWRFDADEGIATGDAVANYVFDNILAPARAKGGRQPVESDVDSTRISRPAHADRSPSGHSRRAPIEPQTPASETPRSEAPTTEPASSETSDSSAIRSIDGTGNNVANPDWGSAGTNLLRTAPADYSDGVSAPAGADRPSPRVISNTIADQGDADITSDRDLSAMIYAFGQFLDHDLDLTPNADPAVSFNITVPAGDPQFDPAGTGTQIITLNRSATDPATGTGTGNPAEQVNVVTAWLDGSQIYGSDEVTAGKLRMHVGGRLKTSPGPDGVVGTTDDLLPLNNSTYFPDGTLAMENAARIVPDDKLFAAGDVRANENIELTSLHTLFVREHNRIADEIAAANPSFADETIYQMARARVIAELQAITHNEWLPALLGRGALDPYAGYDSTVNPGIANEFSTAMFRLGHSLLGNDVEFLDNNGEELAEEIPLSEAFFNPTVIDETGIGPILKYLASDPSSELDNTVVESVRNFLFGPPGSGGLDLASLNIQRGRDHGLADYNTIRESYGLPRVTDFSEITSDTEVQDRLRLLYGIVDNIDAWVGALAEDHIAGSSTGPLIRAVVTDQFERLRDGDRFWYERSFSGSGLAALKQTTLSEIIRRNTEITNVQDDVFFFDVTISGQVFESSPRPGRHQGGRPVASGDRVGGQRGLASGGRGIAGVTVELLDDTGEVVATTTTGAGGFYVFDDLELGTYRVRLAADQGLTQTTPDPSDIEVTRSMAVQNVNFGVSDSQAADPPISHRRHGRPVADHHVTATDEVLSTLSRREFRGPAF